MSIFKVETNVTDYDRLLRALVPITDAWKQGGFEGWFHVDLAINGSPIAERWHPIPVEEWPAERRKNRNKPVDFLHVDIGSSLAVSERVLATITPLIGAAIEALPLDTINQPERRYFVINTLDLVDCLDEQRSTLTRYSDGGIMSIQKYVFRPGTTDGHHLFRLAQDPMGPILASSEFKRLVEENNLVGLEFHPIGEPLSDERSSVGKHAARKPRMR